MLSHKQYRSELNIKITNTSKHISLLKMTYNGIGIKIRKLRELNNLSQPELAHRLGISQTTLCNVESGNTKKIDFLLINKICIEFKIDFDYFSTDKHVYENTKKEIRTAGQILNSPENIIQQIKILIEDNKQKEYMIKDLQERLSQR